MMKMNKKITIIPIGVLIVSIVILFSQGSQESELENNQSSQEVELENNPVQNLKIDVYMPNKSSRPGCEETNSCYIPPEITVNLGDTVIWQNQDVAFHSVTSGTYDEPLDSFDSGHLDPEEIFSITFDEPGDVDYFCTLHPWMKGKVIVKN